MNLADLAIKCVHAFFDSEAGFANLVCSPIGGTVAQTITTQNVVTAPAAVWVDGHTYSGFAAAESSGTYYESDFHEITTIHYLELSDGTPNPLSNFVAPMNMLAAWDNPNVAYGRNTAFCITDPGSYRIRTWCVDRLGATAQTISSTITVADPDTTYSGTDTICFADDADFTGKKTGATEISTISALKTELDGRSAPTRVLFKRGEDIVVTGGLQIDSGTRGTHFGAWGAGAKPILRPEYDTDYVITLNQNHAEVQFTFDQLDFRGEWDSTKELGWVCGDAVNTQQMGISDTIVTMHGCNSQGFATCYSASFGYVTATYSGRKMMVADCTASDWASYAFFQKAKEGTALELADGNGIWIALLGNRFAANVDALNGGGAKNVQYNLHGPVRITQADKVYIAQNDFFSRYGWSGTGEAIADQPCLRLATKEILDAIYVVERNVCEGGYIIVKMDGEDNGHPDEPGNYLLENNLLIATAKTTNYPISVGKGGSTLRNNVGIYFDIAKEPGGLGSDPISFVEVNSDNPNNGNLAEPIRVYSNTLVNLRTGSNNTWAILRDTNSGNTGGDNTTAFSDVTDENNLLHFPNGTTAITTFAPVDIATAIAGVTPRFKGVRYGFDYYSGSTGGVISGSGGTMTIPYSSLNRDLINGTNTGLTTDQTYWDTHLGAQSLIRLGDGSYFHADQGDFAVTTGATSLTITNNSGTDWPSTSYRIKLDRHSNLPAMVTTKSQTGETVFLPRPQAGSAALDAATAGLSPYDDFLRETRPATANQGALEDA